MTRPRAGERAERFSEQVDGGDLHACSPWPRRRGRGGTSTIRDQHPAAASSRPRGRSRAPLSLRRAGSPGAGSEVSAGCAARARARPRRGPSGQARRRRGSSRAARRPTTTAASCRPRQARRPARAAPRPERRRLGRVRSPHEPQAALPHPGRIGDGCIAQRLRATAPPSSPLPHQPREAVEHQPQPQRVSRAAGEVEHAADLAPEAESCAVERGAAPGCAPRGARRRGGRAPPRSRQPLSSSSAATGTAPAASASVFARRHLVAHGAGAAGGRRVARSTAMQLQHGAEGAATVEALKHAASTERKASWAMSSAASSVTRGSDRRPDRYAASGRVRGPPRRPRSPVWAASSRGPSSAPAKQVGFHGMSQKPALPILRMRRDECITGSSAALTTLSSSFCGSGYSH